jgi:thioredoxin:protein disulfide reductase
MLWEHLLKQHCKQAITAAIALMCITLPAPAQITLMQHSSPILWSVSPQHARCTVNDTIVLHIRAKIAKKHYIYQDKLALALQNVQGIRSTNIHYSPAKNHFDSLSSSNRMIYADSVSATMQVIISAYSSDTIPLTITCSYQGCNSSMCFLPQTDTLHVILYLHKPSHAAVSTTPAAPVIASTVQSVPPAPERDAPLPVQPQPVARGGILALFFAFLGGLLTCLTPCVYPLIPVTIGIFGAAASRNRFQTFLMSLTYVAGISVMFSALGFVLAYTGQVFGQFMGNPWIIGALIALFCIFGISLLGAFDFQLPAGIQNKLASLSSASSGYKKVFIMGLVAGIIAAPCTGPSLGAILTYVATTKSPVMGTLLLFSFSVGLGLPFLFLGTFAGLLASRPKPGPWMEQVKSVLGIIMFIVALYYARPLIPALNALKAITLTGISISIIAIAAGIAGGATYLSYHTHSWTARLRKTAGIAAIIIGSFALLNPLVSGSHTTGTHAAAEASDWQTDFNAGLAYAKQHHMPVIVDYYADWCLACAELDKTTFADSSVKKSLSGFVRIRMDFTRNTPQTKELAARMSIRGLPVLDFYDENGTLLIGKRITGYIPPAKLVEHVQNVVHP